MLLTVINVGRVLDAYDEDHPERGVAEMAEALGVGTSKAHALMTSMAEIGLLRRVAGGRYRIGWRSLELVRLITESTPFRPVAQRVAATIARRSGEVVHVGTLDGGRVVYVDRFVGARGADIPVSSVGSSLPAHCTGVGKVLLAHQEAGIVDVVLDEHGLERRTKNTIVVREQLYAELHRVRADGVAYDREEVQLGLSCVAAPIVDDDRRVVAALSISVPTERFVRAETALTSTVRRAARTISDHLATAQDASAEGP
ncbi:IclR family transcriptional regulator [Patulibacter sp. NPDC049589]|uniref:IclR family transcriptional regulator n=1 Tax=Patulibacter sp. NPDC049589 TaxID=3154731 RepID=UPI00343ACDBA